MNPNAPDATETMALLAVQLAEAEHRVRRLRRAALVDGQYRPREFDRAVQETRRLRAQLADAGRSVSESRRSDAQRAA
jgi:hypothetical protein